MIQTPSAISSTGPAAIHASMRAPRLNSAAIRCSAAEPSGGIAPICRANAIASLNASLASIRPSLICRTSQPSSSSRAPLGSNPLNGASPPNVPVARQRTAARSLVDDHLLDLQVEVRHGREQLREERRTPSGAVVSTWPRMNSRPPGRQQATIASTSRFAIASK